MKSILRLNISYHCHYKVVKAFKVVYLVFVMLYYAEVENGNRSDIMS